MRDQPPPRYASGKRDDFDVVGSIADDHAALEIQLRRDRSVLVPTAPSAGAPLVHARKRVAVRERLNRTVYGGATCAGSPRRSSPAPSRRRLRLRRGCVIPVSAATGASDAGTCASGSSCAVGAVGETEVLACAFGTGASAGGPPTTTHTAGLSAPCYAAGRAAPSAARLRSGRRFSTARQADVGTPHKARTNRRRRPRTR
jgi:hypothetical protein